MSKFRVVIIFLCLLLVRGSVLAKSLKSVWHPGRPLTLAQSYATQGQTSTQEPDDDDDDDDDSDEDDDED